MTKPNQTTTCYPTRNEVILFRRRVQCEFEVGIIEAIDWCAEQTGVTRRSWQRWEAGSHNMRAGLWRLVNSALDNWE